MSKTSLSKPGLDIGRWTALAALWRSLPLGAGASQNLKLNRGSCVVAATAVDNYRLLLHLKVPL